IGEILSDPGSEDETGMVPDLSETEKIKSTAASVSGSGSAITSPLKRERGRPIVRVSLERLDDLVRIVREIVVSRSAIEQRLFDFDQQIDDLHNSTRRLQDICAKMEIDFESSMLQKSSKTEQEISRLGRSRQNDIVDVELFDPLELDRYTDFHESTRVLSETTSDTATINAMLDALRENFDQLFDRQRRLIDEMQDRLMRIRMVEFGTLETRLQRVVRVTCEEEEKKAVVTIENALIEIDTQILDALIEPLMHLLKNAIVHGIESPGTRRLLGKSETGSIKISLVNEDTHIVMTVADDGRGIATFALKEKAVRTGLLDQSVANAMNEEELFDLIFLPGLTTAKKLNLSAGRGVGMSIVKESIESQNGAISLNSQPQQGTTFTVRMPLPLAVTTVVLVNAQGRTYAIPARHLDHIDTFDGRSQHPSNGPKSVTHDGVNYRLEFLNVLAAVSSDDGSRKENNCVLFLRSLTDPLAVVVDDVIRSEEIVIKSLSCPLDRIKGILGAALLGSGELVPILDLREMTRSPIVKTSPPVMSEIEKPLSVLIIDDSPSVRTMTARVITNAGWNAETAKDGVEALAKLKESRQLPDLILSDIEMPRMDGFEFVAALRKSPVYTDVPVIFITSRSSEKHREKAFASGVQEYLTKPFNDRELTSMIRKLSVSRQRPES
ncbi:MAG: response regulator, partial [Acidobacteriota bacterium]